MKPRGERQRQLDERRIEERARTSRAWAMLVRSTLASMSSGEAGRPPREGRLQTAAEPSVTFLQQRPPEILVGNGGAERAPRGGTADRHPGRVGAGQVARHPSRSRRPAGRRRACRRPGGRAGWSEAPRPSRPRGVAAAAAAGAQPGRGTSGTPEQFVASVTRQGHRQVPAASREMIDDARARNRRTARQPPSTNGISACREAAPTGTSWCNVPNSPAVLRARLDSSKYGSSGIPSSR